MDDELNLDLDSIETNVENKLKVKNRFEQLSEKVILTSKERDEAQSKVDTADKARLAAEKERDFFKSFSQISSKHPEATNYQDQILERVNKGYDPEEAALAVLAKEGKLTLQTQQMMEPGAPISVEGGSAPTILQGNKSITDMKPEEKFDVLSKLSNEELARALRG